MPVEQRAKYVNITLEKAYRLEKIDGDDAENRPHHDRRQAEEQLSFQLRIVVIPWMDAFQFCTPLPIWS